MVSKICVLGGTSPRGEVTVHGTKSLVPEATVAALPSAEQSKLRNMPLIRDVDVVSDLLRTHGATVDYDQEADVLGITPGSINLPEDPVEMDKLAGSSRTPIPFAGSLLHNLGEAFILNLGGCHIGSRPVNFHLRVLEDSGVRRIQEAVGMHLIAEKSLKAKPVYLSYPSVGATEQILLATVMAQGITELTNAVAEPEVMDLIAILQKMGAIISADTDRTIRIEGVNKLRGYSHTALPDRTEAGSWACAALATGGDVFVRGARQQSMTSFFNVFCKVGGEFDTQGKGIRFWHPGGELYSMAPQTDAHPRFMADWQQPLAVALTQAMGISIVHETVYEERFGFMEVPNEMGASIQTYGECLGGLPCRPGQRNFYHSAVIQGPTKLWAANIDAPDLRGDFSHLIAALTVEGESVVSGIDTIDRGYEHFMQKLRAFGVNAMKEG